MSLDFSSLLTLYRSELLDRVVPFWLRYGIDWEYGGICTCVSDQGEVKSRDKYMWSQLRAIWTFAALYNHIERKAEWLAAAEHIFAFVDKYGRDANGRWQFLVSKEGRPLQGATSIYADGFAIYGLTELAKANGNPRALALARETFASVQKRLSVPGAYPTAPLPIPPGAKAHGISMIFSLVFTELGRLAGDHAITQAGLDHARQVMTVFLRPEHRRLYEFVRLDGGLLEVPPGRVVVPGHAIESMWFMIHIFRQLGEEDRIRQAIEAIRWHMELGWDAEYGGIVLARDAKGSHWAKFPDAKIWWPHTEALYALLLAYSISHQDWCLEWFQRVHDYAFSRFPVPQYGEWTQNLDRQGNRLDTTIALPVKDPFHLARSLIYCIGALEQMTHAGDG